MALNNIEKPSHLVIISPIFFI